MPDRWKGGGDTGGPRGRSSPGARREAAAFAGSAGVDGAVAESAGLYQLLVESVQDYAIFALDPAGHILNWNAGAQRIKGYTRDEVVGRHFSIFFLPEDVAAHVPEREMETATRDGRVASEGWRVRKDGTRFWCSVTLTALRDDMGLLVGFAKVTRDLTERKQAEQILRDSEERFRLLVHNVKDYGIFMLDPQGHVATWNEGAERIKGYTAADIVGRHFSTFYPPEDVAAGKPPWELEMAVRDGRLEDEGWRVRKDGSRFWANVVITALHNDRGELLGFTKVTRDLTERYGAELALRESEERFRLLVQSVKDYGIFMLDPGGHIASWNEGAQRMKGYTAAEIMGRHFSTFYPPEDIAAGKPAWELEVAVRDGRVEDEGWRVRKDGTRFWANVVITALRGADGTLKGFTKVTRNLTDRREAELRALEATRRAAESEASSRAKSEFLAAMSHELRTPLNAIGGYTELLVMGLRGPVTEDQKTDLERIGRSQRHLLNIINDLLNFSRIEAGQMQYERERVSIQETVAAVALMLEPQALAKGVAFVTGECPPALAAIADRVKVEQIVLNLCSNAVKFTDANGRVEVSCRDEAGRVVVEVSDTGVGIPEEQTERIFEPFVQLGRGLTTAHEGTGLGLAISRDLARAMGGDLTVRS
ncbi:MAG TPA: PAS domain S-box protein, partial [Longimicrobium sp.]|nr:PAS domain S-box protein [Longimicrobium sp.]